MPTADEILAAELCDNILTVDLDNRVIIIPKSVTCIGVESDDNVEVLHFRCPRMYCDVDLSEFKIRINYVNAKGYGDEYEVDNVVVGDDLITFDWVVGRNVVSYKGTVTFNLCLRDMDENGEVVREFNTTVAALPVLQGLEVDESDIQEYSDGVRMQQPTVFRVGEVNAQSMLTADDILGDVQCDNILQVDLNSRSIIIPKSVTCIGVVSDDGVEVLHFRCPRMYCGVDLSEFAIRINYLNAKGSGDMYDVEEAVVSEDLIAFDWVVGRNAVSYKGDVTFNVCLKDIDENGEVTREFNTTIATLPVLPGLEVGEKVVHEYIDILEQWKSDLFGSGDTVEQKIKDAETEALANLSESIGIYIDENSDKFTGPRGYTFTPSMDANGNLSWSNDGGLDNPQTKNLIGPKGNEGTTFTPFVNDSGDLSWTNNDGLDNPETKNLMGPRGYTFTPSIDDKGNLSWSNDGGLANPETKNLIGPRGYTFTPSMDANGNLSWSNDGGLDNPQTKNLTGPRGAAFTYDMFTEEQLRSLRGPRGESIASIMRTAGTGMPGTLDTYTITTDDGNTYDFQVYNGADGKGAGDMLRSVYDTEGKNTDVFKYVDDKLADYSTTDQMNSAIKIVDDKFAGYVTSEQLNSVNAKFANYSTTEQMNASIKAVDDKFANYSTTEQMNAVIDNRIGDIDAILDSINGE